MAQPNYARMLRSEYLKGLSNEGIQSLIDARRWELRDRLKRGRNFEILADTIERMTSELEMRQEKLEAGPDGPITELTVVIHWSNGRDKSYSVTGTRHAYYLIRKLANDERFRAAVVWDILTTTDGRQIYNPIHLVSGDVVNDPFGKFRALLNRNNTNYDLRGGK